MASPDKIRELWIEYMREYLRRKKGVNTNYGSGSLVWDGGVDKFNKKRKNSWVDLAQFAEANKLNLRKWISTLFANWSVPRDPTPPDLKSANVVEEAKKEFIKLDLKLLRELHDKRFMNFLFDWMNPPYSLTKIDAAARILLDDQQPLTPLFRYCWLSKLGIEGKDRYLKDSLKQLASNKSEYLKYWSDLIPTNLINME